jgi:hypothetical protein
MTCYTADHHGVPAPSSEIEEITWLTYADRDRVSPVDQIIFDHLHQTGQLHSAFTVALQSRRCCRVTNATTSAIGLPVSSASAMEGAAHRVGHRVPPGVRRHPGLVCQAAWVVSGSR